MNYTFLKKMKHDDKFAVIDLGSVSVKICVFCFLTEEGADKNGYLNLISKKTLNNDLEEDDYDVKQNILRNIKLISEEIGISIKKIVFTIDSKYINVQDFILSDENFDEVITKHKIKKIDDSCIKQFAKNNSDKIILHFIKSYYILDDKIKTKHPVDQLAKKIELSVKIISMNASKYHGLMDFFEDKNYEIIQIIPSVVSNQYVLKESERKDNILYINMNSTETSFSVVENQYPSLIGLINYGGSDITKQISKHFGLSISIAERIKKLNLNISVKPDSNDFLTIDWINKDLFDVDNEIKIEKLQLVKIMSSSFSNILFQIKDSINLHNKKLLTNVSSVVLLGGCMNTVGVQKLANEIFKKYSIVPIIELNGFAEREISEHLKYSNCIGSANYILQNKNRTLKDQKDNFFLDLFYDMVTAFRNIF